ncbi:MAG: hypothetical protein ACI4VL_05525 [Bacilli bacterium]
MEAQVDNGFVESIEGIEKATGDLEGLKQGIKDVGDNITALQDAGLWNIGEAITPGMNDASNAIFGVIKGLS